MLGIVAIITYSATRTKWALSYGLLLVSNAVTPCSWSLAPVKTRLSLLRLSGSHRHGAVASSENDLDKVEKLLSAIQCDVEFELQLSTFKLYDQRQVI